MKDFFKTKLKIPNRIPFIILAIVTLLVGFPLFKSSFLNGHDAMFHLFRTHSLEVALKDGQIIPFVNHYMFSGLGYASNMFYGILTSYLALFFNLFTKNLGLACNLLVIFSIFFSGLFTYIFLNKNFSNKYISLLGAIIYITFPYHLYDIYVRMALGEIISFVFIPLIFLGLTNIINEKGDQWYILSLGASGLLITHIVSAMMVAFFSGFYLILNFKQVFTKKVLLKLSQSLIFSLCISLITIGPMLEAKFNSDYLVFDSAYMHTSGIDMTKSAVNIFEGNSYIVNSTRGAIIITIICLALFIGLKYFKKKNNNLFKQFLILLILSLIFTVNIIPWKYLPNIFSIFQFPWRYLQMTSFLLAVVIAFTIYLLDLKEHKNVLIFVALISLSCNIPLIKLGINNNGINKEILNFNKIKKRDEIARSNGTASAEYLPRNAIYNYDYLVKRGNEPLIITGTGKIQNITKNGTHLSFNVNSNEALELELPYIYYPGYVITINSKKLKPHETKNGLVGIYVNERNAHIISKYRGTNIAIISYVISSLSLLILIIIIIKEKFK